MSELYHYGTLGMKWRRRKWSTDKGKLNSKGKRRYASDNAFRKAGARYEAPGVQLGNLTTMYKKKHKSKRKISKSTIKKMGGSTVVERAISVYGSLAINDNKLQSASANGRFFMQVGKYE